MKYMSTLLALGLMVSTGWAKDKTKSTLPAYVLQAKTVAIIVDPSAEFSMDGPQANRTAQKDVEAAVLKWGRFQLVSDTQAADLTIVLRKGNERLTDQTLPDPRQNSTAIGPGDRGGPAGAQRGPQAGVPPDPGLGSDQPNSRYPMDIGGAEDYFAVFKGGENPRNATPVWKYVGRDGLNPQTVPAVTAFKKALANAEKAAQKEATPR